MPQPTVVIETPDALGRKLAVEIADGIERAAAEGRRYVLGCPGGRTPRPTYAALAEVVAERSMGISHVVIAMMDEYAHVDESGAFVAPDADAHYSCGRFGRVEILDVLNATASVAPIPIENLWVPDPADPASHERRLAEAGGVDLFILASGASDGHVAFNPPGSSARSQTRIVELAQTTREDNLGTFPEFASLDDVPRYGVTVGIHTIASLSRRMVMLILGEHKHEAYETIINAAGYDPAWPATVVALGENASIYADPAAAGAAT